MLTSTRSTRQEEEALLKGLSDSMPRTRDVYRHLRQRKFKQPLFSFGGAGSLLDGARARICGLWQGEALRPQSILHWRV